MKQGAACQGARALQSHPQQRKGGNGLRAPWPWRTVAPGHRSSVAAGPVAPWHLFRTVFFLIPVISLYTIVLGSLSVLSSLWPRADGRFAHACARAWSWLILATTGVDVHVQGLEHLSRDGAYVFVSNHQSIYDIPVLFWSLPFQLRIIAKESLGGFPFLGWHLKRCGHMLVDRRNPDRVAIQRRAAALARRGASLIIFPEGTRSANGTLGPFKAGSFLLALETGLALVPLAVRGTRRVMPKGELTVRPGRVDVIVHPPLEPAENAAGDSRRVAAAKALSAEVGRIIEAQLGD